MPFFPNFGEATVHCSYLVNLKPRGGGEGVTRPTFSFSKAKRYLSVRLRSCRAEHGLPGQLLLHICTAGLGASANQPGEQGATWASATPARNKCASSGCQHRKNYFECETLRIYEKLCGLGRENSENLFDAKDIENRVLGRTLLSHCGMRFPRSHHLI